MPDRDDRGQEILQKAAENVARFRQGEAHLTFKTSTGEAARDIEVQIVQKSQDFLFGNLAFDLVWGETPYQPDLFKQRFLELFNFAIFPFYWSYYERTPGMTEGRRALPVLEWCLANGITPKGHPLVWPYDAGVPEWLYDMPEGSAETLIKARVMNLVKGFEKSIQVWDVTNEAVNHVSWDEAAAPAFRARRHETSMWRGTPVSAGFKREIPINEAADWVEKSFRWAYAANPKATLIVNDYNQEVDPHIRQRFFDLVKELQTRDVPVSGIGLQVHAIDYWLSPMEIWDTLEMYQELHCPVHITELHQPSWDHPIEGSWRQGAWNETAQAEYLEQLYRLFYGHPAVVSINYWGLSDRNIWIESAGLIDKEYRPKPVFTALKKLIKGEWMTPDFSAQTDSAGRIVFQGFYGEYDVVVKRPGQKFITCRMHLSEQTNNTWVFVI